MSAPRLNRRLTLEAPVRVADGAGGYVSGWTTLGHLWGQIVAGAGREATGTGAALARVPYRITVRAAPMDAPSRPKPDQRLREGVRVLRILAVTEGDADGRYLICHAEEEEAT